MFGFVGALIVPFLVAVAATLEGSLRGSAVQNVLVASLVTGAVGGAALGAWLQFRADRGVPDWIHIYEKGVAWGKGRTERRATWPEITSIRFRRLNTDIGTRLGATQAPVVNQYFVATTTSGAWQINNSYADGHEIANALYEATQQRIVDGALRSAAAGESTHFGALILQPESLRLGERSFSLADLESVTFSDDLELRLANGVTARIPVERILNQPALETLLENRQALVRIAPRFESRAD